MTLESSGGMSRCPNCSSELAFEYCPRCGQRRIHPQDLSARHFGHELVDEIATLHERFKTLRTLRQLLVPGFLSAEFLAGRRQPYLTPFKVYLVCAAMFFLAAPAAGFSVASMLEAPGSIWKLAVWRLAGLGNARPAAARASAIDPWRGPRATTRRTHGLALSPDMAAPAPNSRTRRPYDRAHPPSPPAARRHVLRRTPRTPSVH
jgi:hypothetical protein